MWQEADDKECFAFKIEEVAGMKEQPLLIEQPQDQLLFRNVAWDFEGGIPASLVAKEPVGLKVRVVGEG